MCTISLSLASEILRPNYLASECLLKYFILWSISTAHSLVHGGAEQDAVSSEISASGAEERAILVQEPTS